MHLSGLTRATVYDEAATESFLDFAAPILDIVRKLPQWTPDARGCFFLERTLLRSFEVRSRLDQGRMRPPVRKPVLDVIQGASFYAATADRAALQATDVLEPNALDSAARAVRARVGGTAASGKGFTMVLEPDLVPTLDASLLSAALDDALDQLFSASEDMVSAGVHFQDRIRQTLILRPDGKVYAQAIPWAGLRLDIVPASGKAGEAIMGSHDASELITSDALRHLTLAAVRSARFRESAATIPAARLPVVFAAGTSGVWLHEAVGHLLERDLAFERGIGRDHRIASDILTVWDDPTLDNARGSYKSDDEGHLTARTDLVTRGVVTGFMTDAASAGPEEATTGNGRRQDYRFAPLPRMSNLVAAGGPGSPDDLIQDAGHGVYVADAAAGTLDSNPDAVVLRVKEAYLIEKGRIGKPVSDVVVRMPVRELLERVTGIAGATVRDDARGYCRKRGQVVPVSTSTPAALFRDIPVTPES